MTAADTVRRPCNQPLASTFPLFLGQTHMSVSGSPKATGALDARMSSAARTPSFRQGASRQSHQPAGREADGGTVQRPGTDLTNIFNSAARLLALARCSSRGGTVRTTLPSVWSVGSCLCTLSPSEVRAANRNYTLIIGNGWQRYSPCSKSDCA